MRILQISAFCGQGAPGTIALGIHGVLVSHRHRSVIAWGRSSKAPESVPTIRIGKKTDYYTHALYTRLTDRCGFGSVNATRRFLEEVEKFQPDLIQLHMLHGYFVNLEILFRYLKETGIPVVWTFHDCWAITGHCPYFDMIGCKKWKTGCHHCPQRLHHPTSWMIDGSAWNWNRKRELFTSLEKQLTVVTPSVWLAEIVRESFLKDFTIRVINNGVDTQVFQPRKSEIKKQLGLERKKIVLGVSSSWAPSKGMADFCALSEKLPREYQIVLVGLSHQQMHGLPEWITGLGRTSDVKELAELYSAADVFVNPTYEDNYPTTNLESLSCGTPVITYRTGGSVEAVEESGAGSIVPQGDIDALAEAIMELPDFDRTKPLFDCDEKQRYQEYLTLYHQIVMKK